MPKYFLFPALLVLSATVLVHGQSDFRQGYVIKWSGDTLKGYIDYRGNKSNARQCLFTINPAERELRTDYSPDQIREYRFTDGKYYVSREVWTGDKQERLFLEYLINGRVDIFYFRDDSGEHYFAEKGSDTLVPLTNDEKIIYRNGVKYSKESRQYAGVLKYMFRDSPASMKSAETIPLSHQSLIRISKNYHEEVCHDTQCIIYQKRLPRSFFYLGPVVGLSVEILSVTGEMFTYEYYMEDADWPATVDPLLGVFTQMNLPALNERMFFGYRITLNRFTAKAHSTHFDPVTNLTMINNTTITNYMLENALTLKYLFGIRTVRPYAFIGGFLDVMVSTAFFRQSQALLSNGTPILDTEYTGYELNNLMGGPTAGGGAEIFLSKKWVLDFDVRYNGGIGLFRDLYANMIEVSLAMPFRL